MALTQADRQTSCFAGNRQAEIKPTMDKRQLIDEIRKINLSAAPRFLEQFEEKDLLEYLDHLQAAARNDLRIGGWVRKKPRFRMAS
jgi:hypothetical protein